VRSCFRHDEFEDCGDAHDLSFFCCWKSRGRQGFQDRIKLTFPHVFTKKCGFQPPKRGLAQNFTPTISAKSPGAYGRGPFSLKQTVEHHLHSQRSDLGVVHMTYKRGLDRQLESSSKMYSPPTLPLRPIAGLTVYSRGADRSHEISEEKRKSGGRWRIVS